MAKEKVEQEEKERPDTKQLSVSKDASVDFPVEVIATDSDIYHETGTKYHVGSKKAKELVTRGWVKMAAFVLFILTSMCSYAQTSVYADLYNATNTFSQALLQASVTIKDTVTNTGTGVLYTKSRVSGPGTVTVQVVVTKVSGTVAGSITLLGSLDGVNFKAIPTRETQTAITVITAADASSNYSIRLPDSPYLWYAVSWTGSATMVATFTAKIMKH